ncbi:NADPH-dependent FMN reductase [Acholeplasma laidlawii]|jgi:NAD(P)H-dependent FMN reductase|uniref:NAD(P)H-dependent FMN reductase n=2 Tax=Acholeplasma laidlawii TaxID=2148 RepID=A9NET4_ACHLI|nr:NAD(P)H-dependent oxidoreductase [Acholeplasma laidlawii]ABX80864.1 NAD(P)H-dependent FMN reductase [Acholeplasma laidlawii PG-8A]NWH10576.1 NAD(P)H-dependent oxidoreductase [Acholeplasma laidlawii]NWH11961.1 NAD(P)H-dependent oxidoreductase [Acholeplasma laidlawii]NWH12630.1 NAD(P)H-dependent oxidoreductase [Acholeplasma laidlawii]NWH13990.1 NAD(P)H-dependent oxidoreductase [Acholeplasma laidlawii]
MSLKIGIIIASVREGRNGKVVADWVLENGQKRNDKDVTYELVDLKSFDLPLLGATPTESQGIALKNWSETMASYDGYILVTPEYNHLVPGALVNAFNFLNAEVNNKALAFVGYGFLGAARGIVGFRAHLAYQQIAMTQQQINISFVSDFKNAMTPEQEFAPGAWHTPELEALFTQLLGWSKALKALRNGEIK